MVGENVHPPPPPSTPERAPWEDVQQLIQRLNRLIELLEAWIPGVIPGVPGVPGVPGPPGVPAAPVEVTAPWEAQEPVEIYRQSLRTTGTFYSPRMIDWRKGKRLVIKVHSTFDQTALITAVGNIENNRIGIVEIGPSLPCLANTDITIGMAWDDWMPFIGVKIVVSTAPTTGVLQIDGVIQK